MQHKVDVHQYNKHKTTYKIYMYKTGYSVHPFPNSFKDVDVIYTEARPVYIKSTKKMAHKAK